MEGQNLFSINNCFTGIQELIIDLFYLKKNYQQICRQSKAKTLDSHSCINFKNNQINYITQNFKVYLKKNQQVNFVQQLKLFWTIQQKEQKRAENKNMVSMVLQQKKIGTIIDGR
ncbi:unnamed protein product [Paramecium octaurelia]|uniref:Uncharacterized protein n=1 Tax=Paramecium octaurelia TaxID=43137 RepID=A0A8S1XBJ6_PAROT|nr:unnamed protein product [Paramecium octaurelia]